MVVLMPPAIEPGEPPMSIKKTESTFDGGEIDSISTKLNPAVRKIAVWEMPAQMRCVINLEDSRKVLHSPLASACHGDGISQKLRE